MPEKLVWDQTGERRYETGVKQCALYPMTAGTYPKGVAWNGITAITESPSGAEPTAMYADDIKYLDILSAETYAATIEAYMYPDEFKPCNGEAELAEGVSIGQQTRQKFGLCYKTTLGNDTDGEDYGYELHLVYGGLAAPAEEAHNSKNESPEGMTMSWSVSTTPVDVEGKKPTATVTINSVKAGAQVMKALEDVLYGSDKAEARLPLPNELKTLIEQAKAA
ncbi:hypothetical protein LG34_05995 [Eubacterium ramulus]|uniref:Phage major tail protein, phi13 family n=1 Tax=Eubacterium ramulus TaxID=39490 RepID=A0A2V1JQF8_EUBRA|nr:hypothetical protein [Eubacterium ramulus]PWE87087.1 hypothetical protein LG34_05995 [Eubacterium ramulus]